MTSPISHSDDPAHEQAGDHKNMDKKDPMDARSMARLAAVQALYQMEHSKTGVRQTVREFQDHRLGTELDGNPIRDADPVFFEDIVTGVVALQERIDPFIEQHLSDGWTLKRLDATARAILRAGLYELIRRLDVPYRVIIDEYVEIAGSFFDPQTTEPGFINGVLDASAREVRDDA